MDTIIQRKRIDTTRPLTGDEIDRLTAQLVAKTREHPLIVRGASVRATIAVKEIAYGYRLLHDSLTRDDIKKAALVALPHRIVPSAAAGKSSDEIILEIVQEVVFGIRSLEHGDPFKDRQKQPHTETETKQTLIEELLTFQNNEHRGTTRLQNLHADYIRRKNAGEIVEPEKLDYDSLKALVQNLETDGILTFGKEGDGFTLQGTVITNLMQSVLKNSLYKTGSGTHKGQRTEKTYVRRYQRGDISRDVSPRHTLRRLIHKGKQPDMISVDDIRCFERVPPANRDIVICIDSSESMRENNRVVFAKIAAAGMAVTAIKNGAQVGIVLFSNTAACVAPLTKNVHLIADALLKVHAGKYTNIGAGIRKSREMLLKKNRANRKQVIIISDGLPNIATEEKSPYQGAATGHVEMNTFSRNFGSGNDTQHNAHEYSNYAESMFRHFSASHSALQEVKKSRGQIIEMSFIYIGDHDGNGKTFSQKAARLGGGSFLSVGNIPDLPAKALGLVS
jgi:Mg-chelatase subunit ChlD